MKQKYVIYRRLALAILVALVASGCQLLGTRQQPLPSPVPLRDLLVDGASYPPGWEVENVVEDDIAHEIESLSIYYRNPTQDSPVSRHVVLRYASRDEAQQDFDLLIKQIQEYEPRFVAIPQLAYTSQTAQRTSLLCMKNDYDGVEKHRLCIAIAQYGSYISRFSTPIDKRFMKYTDLTHILGMIDSKMATVANT